MRHHRGGVKCRERTVQVCGREDALCGLLRAVAWRVRRRFEPTAILVGSGREGGGSDDAQLVQLEGQQRCEGRAETAHEEPPRCDRRRDALKLARRNLLQLVVLLWGTVAGRVGAAASHLQQRWGVVGAAFAHLQKRVCGGW